MVLLLAACTSTPGTGGGPSPTASAGGVPVTGDATIEELTIDEPAWQPDGDDWELLLTWRAPDGVTIDHYESMMTDEIRSAILEQQYKDLFVNAEGVMFGNGQLWRQDAA